MGMDSRPSDDPFELCGVVLNRTDFRQLRFNNRKVSHIGILTSLASVNT